MANTVDKVIAIALDEVGYLEKKSNSKLYDKTANAGFKNYTKYAYEIDTKYPNFYNGKKNGYAYCDIFVDWCFIEAFGVSDAKKLLCQPSKSLGAGCKYSANYYKNKGQFYKKNPKIGDQIFFYNSSRTSVAHTGLVYNVDATYVYTVEGNTSGTSGVIANGGAVAKKKYKLSYNRIYGYGRPKYDESSVVDTEKNEEVVVSYAEWTGYVNTKKSNLNVRSSASSKNSSNIIGSLAKGKSVKVVGEDGDWYKINYNNRTAYVSKSYISKTNPLSTPVFKPYKAKVTAKSGLNIRKEARVTSKKIGALARGTVVTISKESNKWGYIADKNGWVSLDYIIQI